MALARQRDFEALRGQLSAEGLAESEDGADQRLRHHEALRNFESSRDGWWTNLKISLAFYILIPAAIGILTFVEMIMFLIELT